jgi:signal transduction histidine kinase
MDKIHYKSILVETHYLGFENFIINTDVKRLQQVFLNILSNAVKFTDREGKIFVIVEKTQGEVLRVSVADNGVGIKKKDQDKLFKMFGSIKNEKKKFNVGGIGLGLVISKLIVNKFDGQIDFISKFKKGSTFFYTFQLEPNYEI